MGFQSFLLLTPLLKPTEHNLPCQVIVAEPKQCFGVTSPYIPFFALCDILIFIFLIRSGSVADNAWKNRKHRCLELCEILLVF